MVAELGRTNGDQLVVLNKLYKSASHIEDAIEWLEAESKPQGKIYAEHDPEELAQVRRTGYRVRQADKNSSVRFLRRMVPTQF